MMDEVNKVTRLTYGKNIKWMRSRTTQDKVMRLLKWM